MFGLAKKSPWPARWMIACTLLTTCGCGPGRIEEDAFVEGDAGSDGGMADAPATTEPIPDCDPTSAALPLATGIRLDAVTVNQGVSVIIVDGTEEVANRNSPIVVGRDALLRVSLSPETDYLPRELIVRLTLDGRPREIRQRVNAASAPANLSSTLNFEIPGQSIFESTEFAVEVLEAEPCLAYPGDEGGARFPSRGSAWLGAAPLPGSLQIVVVPVRYLADDSGRTPPTDANTIENLADRMAAMFPLHELGVRVRSAPLDFESSVTSEGEGWSALLNACLSLRSSDGAADNEYYYCALRPTESPSQFCAEGCIAGLGPVPSAEDTYNRGAIGLLYQDGRDTFVHEIGHTLGLAHAPCGGARGADPSYPYPDAAIGVVGYDLQGEELKSTSHRDVMAYCDPTWISDYHYDKLFDRLVKVTAAAPKSLRARSLYRPIVIDVDDFMTLAPTTEADGSMAGDPLTVELLDPDGNLIDEVPGILVTVSHVPGGIVYFAEPATVPSAVRIQGYGTVAWEP